MTKAQNQVLWIGIILIAANLAIKWASEIRPTLFAKQPPKAVTQNANSKSSGTGTLGNGFAIFVTPLSSLTTMPSSSGTGQV